MTKTTTLWAIGTDPDSGGPALIHDTGARINGHHVTTVLTHGHESHALIAQARRANVSPMTMARLIASLMLDGGRTTQYHVEGMDYSECNRGPILGGVQRIDAAEGEPSVARVVGADAAARRAAQFRRLTIVTIAEELNG